jgi:NitT/TauT family transport system permease protein
MRVAVSERAVDLGPETGAATVRSTRTGWSALPRRRPPRPTPQLFAIRSPLSRRARWTLMALSILGPLAAWWALSVSGFVEPAHYLPTPAATFSAGLEMFRTGQMFTDAWATVQRVLLGFGLAIVLSVPLGIIMGSFRSGTALAEPVIGLMRYLPATAFIPLLIIWLGLNEPPKVALIFLGTFFFNTLMTADVVRGVPIGLIDVSYTLGSRVGEVVRKVIIPHSLPGMIDAVRVNAAAAWNFVIVAELIAPDAGLGYRIKRLERFTQIDRIFAVLVVIAVLGLVIDILLRILRDRVGRWVP